MAGFAGWLTAVVLAFALNVVSCGPAVAWGDEGHEVSSARPACGLPLC